MAMARVEMPDLREIESPVGRVGQRVEKVLARTAPEVPMPDGCPAAASLPVAVPCRNEA